MVNKPHLNLATFWLKETLQFQNQWIKYYLDESCNLEENQLYHHAFVRPAISSFVYLFETIVCVTSVKWLSSHGLLIYWQMQPQHPLMQYGTYRYILSSTDNCRAGEKPMQFKASHYVLNCSWNLRSENFDDCYFNKNKTELFSL